MAGLRDYVFTELKPTIIHVHGTWASFTGLMADPRIESDYDLVRMTSSTGANYVRKDTVANPQTLEAVRAFAAQAGAEQANISGARTRSCGPVLTPSR
jgi:hypothetical protein